MSFLLYLMFNVLAFLFIRMVISMKISQRLALFLSEAASAQSPLIGWILSNNFRIPLYTGAQMQRKDPAEVPHFIRGYYLLLLWKMKSMNLKKLDLGD